jgi:NlpC/P60 family putative phage cell wall peptidase
MSRDAILAEARLWIGTPYVHGASLRGAGADCLGLVRGVWRAVLGPEPEMPPAYLPAWAERGGAELLRDAARRHLREIDPAEAAPGDVLLFRFKPHLPAKHAAILSAPDRMIHACEGRTVMDTALVPWWLRRLAFAFSFPV